MGKKDETTVVRLDLKTADRRALTSLLNLASVGGVEIKRNENEVTVYIESSAMKKPEVVRFLRYAGHNYGFEVNLDKIPEDLKRELFKEGLLVRYEGNRGVLLSKDGVLRIGNYVIQNMFRLGASAPPEMYDRENYKVLGTIGRGIFVMRKKQEPTTKQLVEEIQKASSYKAVAPEEMSAAGYAPRKSEIRSARRETNMRIKVTYEQDLTKNLADSRFDILLTNYGRRVGIEKIGVGKVRITKEYTPQELIEIARKLGKDVAVYSEDGSLITGELLREGKRGLIPSERLITAGSAYARKSESGIARFYVATKEGKFYAVDIDANEFFRGAYRFRNYEAK